RRSLQSSSRTMKNPTPIGNQTSSLAFCTANSCVGGHPGVAQLAQLAQLLDQVRLHSPGPRGESWPGVASWTYCDCRSTVLLCPGLTPCGRGDLAVLRSACLSFTTGCRNERSLAGLAPWRSSAAGRGWHRGLSGWAGGCRSTE